MIVESDTKTIDAPYSDTFSIKECWVVLSKGNRSIVQKFVNVHFVKYTMFKSKIMGRAEEGVSDTNKKWYENAKA